MILLPCRLVLKNWNGVATRSEIKFEDVFSCFDKIPVCDTARQTDGQTDILRQHNPRYA